VAAQAPNPGDRISHPFYFIRRRVPSSPFPALIAAPAVFLFLFLAKVVSRSSACTRSSHVPEAEAGALVHTLLMSTGLTFGTNFGPLWIQPRGSSPGRSIPPP